MPPLNLSNQAALQSVLAAMEEKRKKIASTQTNGYLFLGSGILLFILGASFNMVVPAVIAALGPIIYGGIVLYKIDDDLQAYKQAYKRDVIGASLKSINESLTISPGNGIYETEFAYTQLFQTTPDRYHSEDLVKGKIDKTAFFFAEVHAEYKTTTQTKNGTQTQWHDIFKGIIFAADFNKNFTNKMIIRPKYFGSALGSWLTNVFSSDGGSVVKLENPDFDKAFITYGNDQVGSRYILTPMLMERILKLNDNSKYQISLSFLDSRMYIAFPLDRNYFEAPVFKSLLKMENLNDDINAINFMCDIVQELDLNTRIWGKS
ncbi:DUF3137 domain-containing protein [Pedobacter sandarakinus]|uniref:DUF3137 domain-containing protein n=1 Tax=Pedobacter sandarakinus TaxID=353156 RepID=UPI0022465E7A|nr:DUF3137 domain-containing protein [Pedobacter sandarakinus]MCX2573825.1 DUF3137 domain-containing protein [Pedobacter sandarakinus]